MVSCVCEVGRETPPPGHVLWLQQEKYEVVNVEIYFMDSFPGPHSFNSSMAPPST